MRHFLYLFSVLLFCGPAIYVVWRREKRIIRKYVRVLIIMIAISIPIAALDYFSLRWQAWEYNSAAVLPLHPLTQIETYFFSAAVTFLVGAVTLVYACRVDLRSSRKLTVKKVPKRARQLRLVLMRSRDR